jgi:hypothetical protein
MTRRLLPRRRPTYELRLFYSAPDAETAERAHEEAIAAICEGEGTGDNHVCKNFIAASVPDFPTHERSGRPYFVDVSYRAADLQDAKRLRQQAIDAINLYAHVDTATEVWPRGLWWRYDSLPLRYKHILNKRGLASAERPPGIVGAALITMLSVAGRAAHSVRTRMGV